MGISGDYARMKKGRFRGARDVHEDRSNGKVGRKRHKSSWEAIGKLR